MCVLRYVWEILKISFYIQTMYNCIHIFKCMYSVVHQEDLMFKTKGAHYSTLLTNAASTCHIMIDPHIFGRFWGITYDF